MYIKSQTNILTYRLIYLGLCGYGILRHLSISDSIRNINMLSYFTIQSNILCFLVILCSAIHTLINIITDDVKEYSRALKFFRGMSFLVITITFLTYSVVLTRVGFSMEAGARKLTINDVFVHYMIPVMTWIDFMFFQPKPSFEWKDPLKWIVAPLIYFVAILIKGKYMYESQTLVGIKRYPYYFLDAETYGYPFVFKYAMIFLVASVALGYLICFVDFILGMLYTKMLLPLNSKITNRRGNKSDFD